jgi:hypothetical protein
MVSSTDIATTSINMWLQYQILPRTIWLLYGNIATNYMVAIWQYCHIIVVWEYKHITIECAPLQQELLQQNAFGGYSLNCNA